MDEGCYPRVYITRENIMTLVQVPHMTAKEEMLLSRRRSCFGSETEAVRFKESPLRGLHVFGRQIFNKASDIVGKADVQASANVSVSAIVFIDVRREELFLRSTEQVVSYIALSCPNYALSLRPLQRPLVSDGKGSSVITMVAKWKGWFQTMEVQPLRSGGLGRAGVTMKKSLI